MLSQTCLILSLALAAPAEGVKIEWLLKEGDVFYTRSDVNMQQTIKAGGRTVEQNLKQSTLTRFTIVKKNADKSIVLKQKILKIKGEGNLTNEAVQKKVEGTEFTVTLDDRGKVTKFDGYKAFITKLAGDNDKARATLESMLSEDTYKQVISETFSMTPNKVVKKGDQWTRDYKVSMGPIGDFKGQNTFTYAEPPKDGKELAQLTFTATMTYSAPGNQPQGLPFQIVKGNLKAEDFKGTMLFDLKAGRLVESSTSARFKGTLTISAQGQKADMELEQKMEMKSRLSSKEIPLD
jgi:Family of unknown function (DUF6263)